MQLNTVVLKCKILRGEGIHREKTHFEIMILRIPEFGFQVSTQTKII
jgi:hypothetical protein